MPKFCLHTSRKRAFFPLGLEHLLLTNMMSSFKKFANLIAENDVFQSFIPLATNNADYFFDMIVSKNFFFVFEDSLFKSFAHCSIGILLDFFLFI